jgi:uncharacterized protein (UPF0371 family)
MTKKVYKSAHGREIDMGALILQHENVRAVGNMGVNARGDVLDSNNQVIENSSRRISKQYSKQVAKTSNEPVNTSVPKSKLIKKQVESTNESTEQVALNKNEDEKGIASAIAKAKFAKDKISGENKPK